MSRTRAIADNAITDKSLIESGKTLAHFQGQYLAADWYSEESEYGIDGAVGVIRVNVDPADEFAVGLSVGLESEETGFDVGVMPCLTRSETEQLIEALQETLDGLA